MIVFSVGMPMGCGGRTTPAEPPHASVVMSDKSEHKVFFRAEKMDFGTINGAPKCCVMDDKIFAYIRATCVVNKQKTLKVYDALKKDEAALHDSGPPTDDGIVNIPKSGYEPVLLHLDASSFPGRYLRVEFHGKCDDEPVSGEMKCRVPK